jgi:hypothetical protein
MMKLSPPEPPQNSQQFLYQLVDYYRALLDYHQQAAALAASNLAHVEALTHRFQSSLEQQATLELTSDNNIQSLDSQVKLPTVSETVAPEPSEAVSQKLTLPSLQELEDLLKANRGKMLHLDYIVRILCGRLTDNELNLVTQVTEHLLEGGVKENRWASVPDSPGCWTIALEDIPAITPQTKAKTNGKSPRVLTSRLPQSDRLKRYQTLTAAIEACMDDKAPNAIAVDDILGWLYPYELSTQQTKRAREAVSDILSKKCGQAGYWKRVTKGRYVRDL